MATRRVLISGQATAMPSQARVLMAVGGVLASMSATGPVSVSERACDLGPGTRARSLWVISFPGGMGEPECDAAVSGVARAMSGGGCVAVAIIPGGTAAPSGRGGAE